MMSKRDIISLLETMMRKACAEATKSLEVELETERRRIEEAIGMDKTAKEIEQKVSDIVDTMNQFKEKAKEEGCKPKYGYYGSIDHGMRRYASEMRYVMLDSEIEITSPKMVELKGKIQAVRGTVTTEWRKVISNCSGLKKNKDCVKYLVSLGFDEKLFGTDAVGTAVMVPVNVALLCRKEEVNEVD